MQSFNIFHNILSKSLASSVEIFNLCIPQIYYFVFAVVNFQFTYLRLI